MRWLENQMFSDLKLIRATQVKDNQNILDMSEFISQQTENSVLHKNSKIMKKTQVNSIINEKPTCYLHTYFCYEKKVTYAINIILNKVNKNTEYTYHNRSWHRVLFMDKPVFMQIM